MDPSQPTPSAEKRFVAFRIWRQQSPDHEGRFEEFKVPYRPRANVISSLMEIQRRPVTAEGAVTTPVVWDSNCLEEVCGSCTMNINGRVQMACSSLIDRLKEPIVLEPLRKFPLVRDLIVDRSRMFEALKQVKAWINLDGTYNLGPGPRQSPKDQARMYVLSTCMTCACCLEACPQVTLGNKFIGAAAISQARLFNMHPTGKLNAEDRIRGLMQVGGIQDCGKAQNCVQVCPKEIPLTTSIAAMNREVTKQVVKDLFFQDAEAKAASGPA
ncbi:MAG TPA: succinate dehydrogenase iron-sulfur subunit [Myxococcaceae bacterium]|nr:succinate dehydrogenase iron-sulfur subunit [Myxococcaceae bacterium]